MISQKTKTVMRSPAKTTPMADAGIDIGGGELEPAFLRSANRPPAKVMMAKTVANSRLSASTRSGVKPDMPSHSNDRPSPSGSEPDQTSRTHRARQGATAP